MPEIISHASILLVATYLLVNQPVCKELSHDGASVSSLGYSDNLNVSLMQMS